MPKITTPEQEELTRLTIRQKTLERTVAFNEKRVVALDERIEGLKRERNSYAEAVDADNDALLEVNANLTALSARIEADRVKQQEAFAAKKAERAAAEEAAMQRAADRAQ